MEASSLARFLFASGSKTRRTLLSDTVDLVGNLVLVSGAPPPTKAEVTITPLCGSLRSTILLFILTTAILSVGHTFRHHFANSKRVLRLPDNGQDDRHTIA